MAIARTSVVVMSILLAACGGHEARRGPRPKGAETEPADPAKLRALLARYSPSGHAILTTFEALPTSYTLVDGGPWNIGGGQDFDSYLSDGAPANAVTYLATAVHEITHGYASRMGFQLLAERSLPYGKGADAILADGDPLLVQYTEVFPTVQIDATFPADARTYRYGEYVGQGVEENLGSQIFGVYGLLDEFAAYYQGARTAVDLWPWVRDEAPGDEWVAINYAVTLDAERAAYFDFKLYILHYLVYAREHHPEVYEAIRANTGFRRAFADVDDAYGRLVATIDALEPTIFAFVGSRGVDLDRVGRVLRIGDSVQNPAEDPARRAVIAHLGEEPYASMAREWLD